MLRAHLTAFVGICLSATLSLPLQAHTPATSYASDYRELRARDTVLQSAGWRLIRSNAAYCPNTIMSTGALLQDAESYGDPGAIRAMNGLGGDMFVQAVADGSPAAAAGLHEGEEIVAIGANIVANIALDEEQPWLRSYTLRDLLEADGAANGSVELTLYGRDAPLIIRAEKVCASHFELISGSDKASANGLRVAIGRDFAGFSYPADELAAALAHELAHNILGHPAWLKANGRKQSDIRRTEREADRLMPWLLANAGYDPAAAIRFMRRWGPEHGGGLFRKRTHDGWDERAEAIDNEVAIVKRVRAGEGTADWLRHFRHEDGSSIAVRTAAGIN